MKKDFQPAVEVYHRKGQAYLRMRTHHDKRSKKQLQCRDRFSTAAAIAKQLMPALNALFKDDKDLWHRAMHHVLTDVIVVDPKTGDYVINYQKINFMKI